MSEDINAKAFTHGQDIYFKEGQYNPNSKDGKELLAHEVAHTVQQGEGKVQAKVQRERLKDHISDKRINDDSIRATNEYKAYMSPKLIWQTEFHLSSEEAFLACQTILENLQKGKKVNWQTEAKKYALSARAKITLGNQNQVQSQITNDNDALEQLPDFVSKTQTKNNPIVEKTPQEELDAIKSGSYNGNPLLQLEAAKKVYKLMYLRLNQKDRELIERIIGSSGNEHVRTYQDFIRYEKKGKNDDQILKDVKERALLIIQSDQKIRHTYEFLHKIKKHTGQEKRDEELYKFFMGGIYEPQLTFAAQGSTGQTTPNPSSHIELNKDDSFTLMVYTYLHEMNHYMDIWFNSLNAFKKGKFKPRKEMRRGIRKELPSDLSKQEQRDAMKEGLTGTVDEIIREMKLPYQSNEHPRVTNTLVDNENYRERYNKYIKNPQGVTPDEYDQTIRLELAPSAAGTYEEWGAESDPSTGEITGDGLEMGFAFEKMAFGFYIPGQKSGEWYNDITNKFERKYWSFLEE